MMNDTNNSNNTCGTCGRPFPQTTDSKCNYNNCCLSEYKYTMPACIKKKEPDCMAKAVIPAITVDSVDGITNLANCFVHVTSINTTYYIDDKHRPMLVWAGDVEADWPAGLTKEESEQLLLDNALGLRSQHIFYKSYLESGQRYHMIDVYYDKTGRPYLFGEYKDFKEIESGGGQA